jgi:UDP-3-O-[3-hydroxymyristoyl] N-acetylglucosamine deacetylase
MEELGRLTASSWQRTLKSSIRCTGVGLHTGDKVTMELHPAAADSGIVFRRTDFTNVNRDVPARYDYVGSTNLCTTLVNEDGVSVATVEHIMAALAGCEIDNVIVALDGSEVPIMDGSAEPFVFLIDCAGILEQDEPRRAIQVLHPVTVRDGDSIARLDPADGFSVDFDIDFESAAIGRQNFVMDLSPDAFKTDISRARTFGFLHEVEALRNAGLGQGGTLENVVVVDGDEVMNVDGLRFDNEFVRHKVLDCIGDMYLAGGPLFGHFSGVRAGHGLHHKLLQALFAEEAAWTTISLDRRIPMGAPAWEPEAIAIVG